MPIYGVSGPNHRASRRPVAQDIKKNTTRKQRRTTAKSCQRAKRGC